MTLSIIIPVETIQDPTDGTVVHNSERTSDGTRKKDDLLDHDIISAIP